MAFSIRPVLRHFHLSAFRHSAFRHGAHLGLVLNLKTMLVVAIISVGRTDQNSVISVRHTDTFIGYSSS